tara:strand:+ start:923 stop:2218 length:1296 start_codon:yes stop_codon:yes gene_type:complete
MKDLYNYPDAETAVVAALLYKPDCLSKYLAEVRPNLFHSKLNQEIVSRSLVQIRDTGTVSPVLQCQDIASGAHSSDHKKKLYSRYLDLGCDERLVMRGEVVACLNQLIRRRTELEFEQAFSAIKQHQEAGGTVDAAVEAMANLVSRFERHVLDRTLTLADLMDTDPADELPETLPTGIDWFDAAMSAGAAERGDKIVISAAPGAGKTALALQLTCAMLQHNSDKSALWAMGEMTPKHLRNRAMMCISGLPLDELKQPYDTMVATRAEKKRNAVEAMRAFGSRLHFLQSPLTPAAIEQQIATVKASWCVVDYIQLCKGDNSSDSRLEELDSIVAALARIAQVQGCVMVLISDMPKGAMMGARRDIFDAFKGTSEIAYMADVAYTGHVKESDADSGCVEVEWKCLKNRHGAQVDINTKFDRRRQFFTQVEADA